MQRAFHKNLIAPILAAAAAGILVAMIVSAGSSPSGSGVADGSAQNSSPPAIVQAAATYAFQENAAPVRLIIPSINVDASVVKVGVAPDGSLAVARSYTDVGWYEGGPVPGAHGNAVIEGHLDRVTSPYAVFFDLDKLKPGDEVDVIDALGRTVRFAVTGSEIASATAATTNIFGPSDESHLNLITCEGTWIPSEHQYDGRLVVFTKRIQ